MTRINVNGQNHEVDSDFISFMEVAKFAQPKTSEDRLKYISMTYSKGGVIGNQSGILINGKSISICDNTIFDAVFTGDA